MNELAPELIDHIFSFLPLPSLTTARLVCRRFRDLADHKSQWRNLDLRSFPSLSPSSLSLLIEKPGPLLATLLFYLPNPRDPGYPLPFPLHQEPASDDNNDDMIPSTSAPRKRFPNLHTLGGVFPLPTLAYLGSQAPKLGTLGVRSWSPSNLCAVLAADPDASSVLGRLSTLHLAHIPLSDDHLDTLVSHLDGARLTSLAVDGAFSAPALGQALASLPALTHLAINKSSGLSDAGLAEALQSAPESLTSFYVNPADLLPPVFLPPPSSSVHGSTYAPPHPLRVLGSSFDHVSTRPQVLPPKYKKPQDPTGVMTALLWPSLTHIHLDAIVFASPSLLARVAHLHSLVSLRLADIGIRTLAVILDQNWATLQVLAVWYGQIPLNIIATILDEASALSSQPPALATLSLPGTAGVYAQMGDLARSVGSSLKDLHLAAIQHADEGEEEAPEFPLLERLRVSRVPEFGKGFVAPVSFSRLTSLRLGGMRTPVDGASFLRSLVAGSAVATGTLTRLAVFLKFEGDAMDQVGEGVLERVVGGVSDLELGMEGDAVQGREAFHGLMQAMPHVQHAACSGVEMGALDQVLGYVRELKTLKMTSVSWDPLDPVEGAVTRCCEWVYSLELVRISCMDGVEDLGNVLDRFPGVGRMYMASTGSVDVYSLGVGEMLRARGIMLLEPWQRT